MTNNINQNLFGLAQTVNSGWLDSERAVPYQKSVKKFIEITGIERLQGKSAADTISNHEFVQIVARDGIQLGPNWRDSADTFKAALKDLLRQMGVTGEKRKANGTNASSSSSSLSTEEPEAKRRKVTTLADTVAATTRDREKLKNLQLATIMSSIGSIFPVEMGEIIKSYAGDLEGNEILVDAIHSGLAQEPAAPLKLCAMIQSYCGNYPALWSNAL